LDKICFIESLEICKNHQSNLYVNAKTMSARWKCDPGLRSATSRWLASPGNSKASSLFCFRS